MVALKVSLSEHLSRLWAPMPAYLAKDEAVIVRVLWVLLSISHDVEEQHRHDFSSTAA